MPLTNSQYDEIIRAYDARQLKNEHDREERTRYAYIKIPRLREILRGFPTQFPYRGLCKRDTFINGDALGI